MRTHKIALLAGSIFALASLNSHAGDAGTWYLGVGAGQADGDFSDSKCVDQINSSNGFPVAGLTCSVSSTDTAIKLLGGFNITPNIAIEGAYADLGQVKANASTPSGTAQFKQKTTAFNLDLVGNLPLSNGFGLSAKVGVFDASSEATDDQGDASTTNSSTGLHFGVGGNYSFNKNVVGRLEYERYNDTGKNDDGCSNCAGSVKYNISVISAAVVYNW